MSEIKRVLDPTTPDNHADANPDPEKRRTERTTLMSAEKSTNQITTVSPSLPIRRAESQ